MCAGVTFTYTLSPAGASIFNGRDLYVVVVVVDVSTSIEFSSIENLQVS